MFGTDFFASDPWWIFPVVMMLFCLFMMRRGRGPMICGGVRRSADHGQDKSESAMEILDKRYAGGEIGKQEYEERKGALNKSNYFSH